MTKDLKTLLHIRASKMKHSIIENNAIALVKSIDKFHHLILGKNTSVKFHLLDVKFMGECKLMMVSHDTLVAKKTWKTKIF